MTIKKCLIFLSIFLIVSQVPSRALPHRNEVIDFVNTKFPAKQTQGLHRNELILNVTNALHAKFAHMYGPNEGAYQVEAYLAAFGLAFYTNNTKEFSCAIVAVKKFNRFIRDRVPGRTRTSDVVESMEDIFGLDKHVSKDNHNPSPISIGFYEDLSLYFERILRTRRSGYGGADFYRGLNLTVYWNRVPPSAILPVLSGVPIPINTLNLTQDQLLNQFISRIVSTPTRKIASPSTSSESTISSESTTSEQIIKNLPPVIQNQIIESVSNTFKNIVPILKPLSISLTPPSSVIAPVELESMTNTLEFFQDTYKNDVGVAGKYDFFSSED